MLVEPQFRTKFGDKVWSTRERVLRMLAFEHCLANAQASVGLIPQESAQTINSINMDTVPEFLDAFDFAGTVGNPAIPFVNFLREAVGSQNPAAAAHVHFGTTSQDLIDTSMMLALSSIFDEIASNLTKIEQSLIQLSKQYKSSPMVGRTLLQQATPMTFGLKSATWALGVHEARQRIEKTASEELSVQLGGATGTLALMNPHGPAIRSFMATSLQLVDPKYPWHINRSRVLAACTALAQTAGALTKIANDCLLMMQSEVGEIAEGNSGTSSAMPHKTNPVSTLVPLAALPIISGHLSTMSNIQAHAHERSAGNWHSEWIVIPLLSSLTLSTVEHAQLFLSGLKINETRMAKNLRSTAGVLGAAELQSLVSETIGYERSSKLIQSLLPQNAEQTFAAAAFSNSQLVGSLGKNKLQSLLGYKDHIKECEKEVMRLINSIKNS